MKRERGVFLSKRREENTRNQIRDSNPHPLKIQPGCSTN
jgi:hypothetical protein